jgi:hypothetical protein
VNSDDAALLPTVTTAIENLHAAGLPLNVNVVQVNMTINGKPVQYSLDEGSGEWNIACQ